MKITKILSQEITIYQLLQLQQRDKNVILCLQMEQKLTRLLFNKLLNRKEKNQGSFQKRILMDKVIKMEKIYKNKNQKNKKRSTNQKLLIKYQLKMNTI